MEVLKKGTIEPLMVAMRDRLGNVTTLATLTNLRFDTKRKSDDAAVQSSVAVSLDADYPMTAICLVDTTLSAYTVGEEYKLYVKWVDGSENPLRGPVFFRIEDD